MTSFAANAVLKKNSTEQVCIEHNILNAHLQKKARLCGAIGQRARLLTERMVVRAHPGTMSCYYSAEQGPHMLFQRVCPARKSMAMTLHQSVPLHDVSELQIFKGVAFSSTACTPGVE